MHPDPNAIVANLVWRHSYRRDSGYREILLCGLTTTAYTSSCYRICGEASGGAVAG